jgi:hypothetical protein
MSSWRKDWQVGGSNGGQIMLPILIVAKNSGENLTTFSAVVSTQVRLLGHISSKLFIEIIRFKLPDLLLGHANQTIQLS